MEDSEPAAGSWYVVNIAEVVEVYQKELAEPLCQAASIAEAGMVVQKPDIEASEIEAEAGQVVGIESESVALDTVDEPVDTEDFAGLYRLSRERDGQVAGRAVAARAVPQSNRGCCTY